MRFGLSSLKRGLLFFWALWLTIVCLTNLFDLLRQWGVLGADWLFASGNYAFMQDTTRSLQLFDAGVTLLFIGVVVWEALAAFMLWRAFLTWNGPLATRWNAVYAAFAVSLALWAAFMIADEIFIAYGVEGTHMGIFIAQIVTLLALRLLPDE